MAQFFKITGSDTVQITDGTENAAIDTVNALSIAGRQSDIQICTAKTGQSITAGTGYNSRSVTGGKTFYMTSLCFAQNSGGSVYFLLLDNGVSGTKKYIFNVPNTESVRINFTHPIPFSTNVFVDVNSTCSGFFSISGYEE